MPEAITGGYRGIELVLELNVVGVLRVLFFLIAEELWIEIWLIVRLGVVFALLHVVRVWNGERRDVGWVVVVNIDGVDVLLDRLPGEIIPLSLLWPFRRWLLALGRLLAL